ncbi:hypothetical protein [Candidatus Sulfurimonas baltica]|uniref:Uncharacterized protein n=1 Tax=Candidatus Sulfurimonas baltica TaxID=2740404 RepID=A0A7S7LU86_9BACT|nr:hypothetical protein [Candidatus Sulfurimonas baltica]QOY50913.1 hypothetical protein HUE88_07090 [Candidatus Sulfurimonas baltica]
MNENETSPTVINLSRKPLEYEEVTMDSIVHNEPTQKIHVPNEIPPKEFTNLDDLKIASADIVSLDEKMVQYFKSLLDDDERADMVAQSISTILTEDEIKILSSQLQILKQIPSEINISKYDEVTVDVVSNLEEFVRLIKTRNRLDIEHLKETDVELFQELREAFVKGKILKNRLKYYFLALYGINLSAKKILTQLRIIEPLLFADTNLRSKKKATAVYLLS